MPAIFDICPEAQGDKRVFALHEPDHADLPGHSRFSGAPFHRRLAAPIDRGCYECQSQTHGEER